MRLLEVFKDLQITLKGSGQFGRYPQTFKVEQTANFQDAKGSVKVKADLERRRTIKYLSGSPTDPVESYRAQQLAIEVEQNALTLSKLQERVDSLNQRYPERGFRLRKWGSYVILDQKTVKPDGKRVRDRVPIYVDLATQKFYVPESFYKDKPQLVRFIVTRTLGALGVSQSKYVSKK
jgi:hypothetical protein